MTHYRHISLALALLLTTAWCQAQGTRLDTSTFCCLYTHYIHTTDKDKVPVTDSLYSILEVGEQIYKYGDLSDYASLKNHLPEGVHTYQVEHEDCRIDENLWVYQNYPQEGVLTVHDVLHPSRVVYEEKTDAQQWSIQQGDTTIMGYTCRQAQLSYGGRKWTAWYTEEIPVSSGPWKLYGPPGLILYATDETGTHTFAAYTIFNVDKQPLMKHSCYSTSKVVKRDKLIKTRNKIKTDPQWIEKPYYNNEANASFAVLDKKDRERLEIPYFIIINGIKYPDFKLLHHFQPLELE